jgi:SAM-dependent methyltransferase
MAACGHRVTAVDAAPEMLARARERVAGVGVEFIEADLFDWRAPRQFDTVFFAFWLSHVPPERFADFRDLVEDALRPAGRACFVDSSPTQALHGLGWSARVWPVRATLIAGLATPPGKRRT